MQLYPLASLFDFDKGAVGIGKLFDVATQCRIKQKI